MVGTGACEAEHGSAWGVMALLLMGIMGIAPVVHAQQSAPDSSRYHALQAARVAQAEFRTQAPTQTNLESALLWIEENNIPQQITGAANAAVRILPGGIGPETGLGARLAYTPFYRRSDLDVFLAGGVSTRGYWGVEATAGYRTDRWFGYSYGRWRHRRDEFTVATRDRRLREDGFVVGDQILYDLDDGTVGGVLGVRPTRSLSLALGGAYAVYHPTADPDNQYGAPGGPALPFTAQTRYRGATAHLIWDTRDARYKPDFGERYTPNTDALSDRPLSPHRGTFVAIEAMRFYEATATDGDFAQLQIEGQQYLSFWSKYHTVALRHRTVFTDPDDTDGVPFYQLPTLGGDHTLRGYGSFRFRDLHALVYNIEYRWQIWLMVNLVVFADAGKTFGSVEEWGLTGLDTSVGGGLRIATDQAALLRLEAAHGPDGVRWIVTFSNAF